MIIYTQVLKSGFFFPTVLRTQAHSIHRLKSTSFFWELKLYFLYVCIYIYIYICVCVCVCVCASVSIYVCIHLFYNWIVLNVSIKTLHYLHQSERFCSLFINQELIVTIARVMQACHYALI